MSKVSIKQRVSLREVFTMTNDAKEKYDLECQVTVDNKQLISINAISCNTKDGRQLFFGDSSAGQITGTMSGDAENPNAVIIGAVEEFVNSIKEFDFTNDKKEEE